MILVTQNMNSWINFFDNLWLKIFVADGLYINLYLRNFVFSNIKAKSLNLTIRFGSVPDEMLAPNVPGNFLTYTSYLHSNSKLITYQVCFCFLFFPYSRCTRVIVGYMICWFLSMYRPISNEFFQFFMVSQMWNKRFLQGKIYHLVFLFFLQDMRPIVSWFIVHTSVI